ncbi:histidine protein methyltransferase 1 homolog [Erpetoichthys calabaricus]|uniref:protein-histidine N-methyltransferase n=1 Tax=Erpetoichthys calabaricus TaxID=27687 RepID=A0A8C4RFL4_ERPCA|nr:histidine protein methyltransferase 1 homolog [Erpetoichthys calabaricus]
MEFSFNFDVQVDVGEEVHNEGNATKYVDNPDKNVQELPPQMTKETKEHILPKNCEHLLENIVPETLSVGTLPPLHYLNESVFEQTASEHADHENILSQSISSHSDLISGVYEGGLRIWECTYDLLVYFEREKETFCGKRVLDLGCGAGLLGILALKNGAKQVHFQDYNSTVIEDVTIPNVLLNCEEDQEVICDSCPTPERMNRCNFFSGDWCGFLPFILSSKPAFQYDVILTSETIYNPSYYNALHDIFQSLLTPEGVVYLATKVHYFGVGGGIHLFENFLKEKDIFNLRSLTVVEEGLQRHVVALTFKTKV